MELDQIHPKILKECSKEFAKPSTILFRESIKQGKIPNSWRFTSISILKKGHITLGSNYRPISNVLVSSKILERIIRDELVTHLIENKFVARAQCGFVPSKSCLSNLLETLDYITLSLEEGHNVDEILLDSCKSIRLTSALQIGSKDKGIRDHWSDVKMVRRLPKLKKTKGFDRWSEFKVDG